MAPESGGRWHAYTKRCMTRKTGWTPIFFQTKESENLFRKKLQYYRYNWVCDRQRDTGNKTAILNNLSLNVYKKYTLPPLILRVCKVILKFYHPKSVLRYFPKSTKFCVLIGWFWSSNYGQMENLTRYSESPPLKEKALFRCFVQIFKPESISLLSK